MMETTDMISLVTNVGFPVTLCFILIRYILQTIGEKLDKVDNALNELTETIQSVERDERKDSE